MRVMQYNVGKEQKSIFTDLKCYCFQKNRKCNVFQQLKALVVMLKRGN